MTVYSLFGVKTKRKFQVNMALCFAFSNSHPDAFM